MAPAKEELDAFDDPPARPESACCRVGPMCLLGAGVQVNAQGGSVAAAPMVRAARPFEAKRFPFRYRGRYLFMDHSATDGSGTELGTFSRRQGDAATRLPT
jgi:hypothetical protein